MPEHSLKATFDTKSLLKYAFPTILMMIFMSTYTIVDGVFVSNFVNENALASINIVYPIISFVVALGLMFSTGSNAIIAKYMGEHKDYLANRFFTLVYIVGAFLSVVLMGLILVFNEPLLVFLNATGELYTYSKDYLIITACFAPMIFLQVYSQSFFVTAGKPALGFLICFIGGLSNIVLDYVFIALLGFGIQGAALATGIGNAIPGIFGVVYFAVKRKSPLRFVKPIWQTKTLLMSLLNGMSEFVNNASISITTLLFNIILMQMIGETGVAAISVILYVQMMQVAIYMGYSFGVAPVISFKYGEQNHPQLKQIMKTSVVFISVCSVATVILSFIFAELAVGIFIPMSSETFSIAVSGFRIFSLSYFFMGFNIFVSSMFTAFSNGKISAFLSINRSLIIIVISLLTLPYFLGITGVWLAVPIAEFVSIILGTVQYFKYKNTYKY